MAGVNKLHQGEQHPTAADQAVDHPDAIRAVEDGDDAAPAGTPAARAAASRAAAADRGARPACFRSTAQEVTFVLQATIATATSSFLSGIGVVITASVGADLGMTQGEITWITASTSLTAGAFQLGLGQLADLLGRRMMFIGGMGLFSSLALLAGFARNPFWMDVVCGAMGVGSAIIVPPAIGILGAAYARPSRRKNLAFSGFSAGNPLGFVFGSISCGIASRLFSWRAAYWLLAILWAAFTALAVWTVPRVETYDGQEPLRTRLKTFWKRFDYVGTVLTIFGTGLFSTAITLGPSDGWSSAHVLVMLILGLALLVVFVFWERVCPHPLMPPHIWGDRNFTCILLVVIPGMMSFNSASFWLSYFMQKLLGFDPLKVALHMLPQAIAGLVWNFIAGGILHRINNTLILAMGCVAYIAAAVLLSVMKQDSSYWAFMFPSLILNVVGADFQFNVANMYVMQSLPSHQQSLAGGIFNTLVRLSNVVALGTSTAVYTSVASTPAALENPMLQYTRAFYVSIGLSAVSLVALPFIKLETQGNATSGEHEDEQDRESVEANMNEKALLDARAADEAAVTKGEEF